ncbi:MAG: hypothetical protein ABIH66_13635 [bacterium]
MDYSTKTYKYKINTKMFSKFMVPAALVLLVAGIYLVFFIKPETPLPDKMVLLIFPIILLLFPIIVSKIFEKRTFAFLNTQELNVIGMIDRGNKASLFQKTRKAHSIRWNSIVAIVEIKWPFNQLVHYIYYIDESERRSIPNDIEGLSRISTSFTSIQNEGDLKNEIQTRAQKSVILFDEVKEENLAHWGLTKEDCDKFQSLKSSLDKSRFGVILIFILIITLITCCLILYL